MLLPKGVVVGQVLINGEAPFPFRQLAGVLLRQYIDRKWEVDDDEDVTSHSLTLLYLMRLSIVIITWLGWMSFGW
jgi:hypothetical protein